MDKFDTNITNAQNYSNFEIGFLYEEPLFEVAAILLIQPLASLSLVGSIPGSYYRSLKEPTKIMIFGAIENMIGWHFSEDIRNKIIKKQQKIIKKKTSNEGNILIFNSSDVGYTPLLQSHIRIEHPALMQPTIERYEDYWTQHLKGGDMRHLNGSRNYDWRLENEINALGNEQKEIDAYFQAKKSFFPKYYSSPKKREFIIAKGIYGYKIHTSEKILSLLIDAIENTHSPVYLGTNEGWIDITIKKL